MVNDFSKDYDSHIAFAKAIIKRRHLTIDAGDLVNDAFLALHSSKADYTAEQFRKTMNEMAWQEKEAVFVPLTDWIPPAQKITNKNCSRCKEEKDISLFYFRNDRPNFPFSSYCKDCMPEYRKKHYANLANKQKKSEWEKAQKEQMTDCYIKQLIKSTKPAKRIGLKNKDITPCMIDKKRAECQLKERINPVALASYSAFQKRKSLVETRLGNQTNCYMKN